jgi:8-oxo-dGTP pyrophosphatase MutT (NUDIX family)
MAKRPLKEQVAAIAIHDGRICLVTTSNGKRWIVPKGHREAGLSDPEAARREAWEEAGIVGSIDPKPIGRFVHKKAGGKCIVATYFMQVQEVSGKWPEHKRRQRRWLDLGRAQQRIKNRKLRKMIAIAAAKAA